MGDKIKVVAPDAPRNLTWWEGVKLVFPVQRSMTREEREDFDRLAHTAKRRLYREEELKTEIEKAVHAFAEYLASTASPKGTIQREKLRSFATEFLSLPNLPR